MTRLLCLAPVLALVAVAGYFLCLKSPPPLPDLPLDAWWGPEELRSKQDTSIKPFQVKFTDVMIQDLRQRIKSVRTLTPPLEGISHEYGFNSNELAGWLRYWAEEYDFAARQKFFNQFPQYRTNIQGLDIHFIRVKPEVPAGVEVVPVLLLHGWPGSVREFYEAIPLLTNIDKNRNFALEVIVPSLPGYGFSDGAVRPGLGAAEMAVVFRNLMQRLGFKKYYVQGGDWGAIIGSNVATIFPKEVLGYHTNAGIVLSSFATLLTTIGAIYPPLIVDAELADRMYPLAKHFAFSLQESGYMHIQASKPDTVGVGLSDSPAGLLAYILEKFSTWTDHNQRAVTDHFTREQLVDNLMCYWATNSITTAMRLYSETFNKKQMGYKMEDIPTEVPTWIIQAKYEIMYQPPFILKFKYPNLVNVTVVDDGGHFFAFEKPKFFAEDVLKAIGEFRKIRSTKTEL